MAFDLKFFFQYFSHLFLEHCLIMIILEMLIAALPDQPHAIILIRERFF